MAVKRVGIIHWDLKGIGLGLFPVTLLVFAPIKRLKP
jgi:hypothetical protein